MNKILSVIVLILLSTAPLLAQVNTAWERRYNGTGNGDDGAYAIAVDKSGNVYVIGYGYGSGSQNDYTTIKYFLNGDTAWVRGYNGPGDSTDVARSIAVDLSGNVYVTGGSVGNGTSFDYATVKYDSSGNELWVRRYNGPGNLDDYAYALTVDTSGNLYVTGYSVGNGTSYDYAIIKYDSAGNELWVRRYDNFVDYAYALAVDDSENVYVTGYSYGIDTYYDYATIKYDPQGNQLWVRRYDGTGNGNDYARDIKVDNSYNIYVAGTSDGITTYADYAILKYYSNGDLAWARRYDGPARSDDVIWGLGTLAIDSSKNVYVTGYSTGSGTSVDYSTLKYYPNGDTGWVRRYNGPANDWDDAYAIAIDNKNNIYVTGYSYGNGTYYDYATLKYAQDGKELWSKRYNGPGNGDDVSFALAVDDSGNVYVTGKSIGSGTSYDFATLKYVPVPFLAGDANGDGKRTVADVVYLISYLFKGGPPPNPFLSGDANCDGKVTLADAVYLINFLFKGGPQPPC